MAVQCADCAYFRLKEGIVASGLGPCRQEKTPWRLHSMSYQRLCDKWLRASDDVIAKRGRVGK